MRDQINELAGEVSTLSAQLQQLGGEAVTSVDVAILSDFRLPGGTTASIAEEVRAQAAAGLSTALIHVNSAATSTAVGFSRHIRKVLDLPAVHVVSARAQLHATLLVIRHPRVIETTGSGLPGLKAENAVVVANHPALDAAGVRHYDVEAADRRVRRLTGLQPVWAPISPVVRNSLHQQTDRIRTNADDWVNIFGRPIEITPRTGFVADVPVIGRHSRPQKEKWPASAEDILAAYPDTDELAVEILGGAEVPAQILGRIPESWNVQPFGAEAPEDFLERIDFWVYMHHPQWREAFGRAAMEALAAGCVVILPPYLEEIYGQAAIYSQPAGITELVHQLWASPEHFLEQSRRGQSFAAEHGPQRHLQRLTSLGVSLP